MKSIGLFRIYIVSNSISWVKRFAFAARYRIWLECHKLCFTGWGGIYFYGRSHETSGNISIVGSAQKLEYNYQLDLAG